VYAALFFLAAASGSLSPLPAALPSHGLCDTGTLHAAAALRSRFVELSYYNGQRYGVLRIHESVAG
jgi:hypothetical protein